MSLDATQDEKTRNKIGPIDLGVQMLYWNLEDTVISNQNQTPSQTNRQRVYLLTILQQMYASMLLNMTYFWSW